MIRRLGPLPAALWRHPLLLPAIGFVLLLAVVTLAYLPGLGGELIFDDLPNLQPWQDLGDIDSPGKVATFALSGNGVPGRPLSLLSFLVDDQSWMPDVHSLKRSNLALHLLNTCLVFWLSLTLLTCARIAASARKTALLSLLVAALWALHPLQVSNVSYIIQRMNLLGTLLALAGLLLFIKGRSLLAESPRKGLLLASTGIAVCMPLAVLAKENGLLLCAFALLVERFFFAALRTPLWRLWKALFLWLPLLAFLAYCLVTYRFFLMDYPFRSFNAGERLLTQGPVLLDYLDKLLLPRLHGSGLYFDNFPVSRSLWQPLGTLFSWAFLLGLLAVAWRLRQRLPVFSFGILFYFCGHLMESTLLPLELYFEHRNYLPQFGLWLALVSLAGPLRARRHEALLAIFALLLLALLSVITWTGARLWSRPAEQAAVWYHDNPGSLRTTLSHANQLVRQGELEPALAVLAEGRRRHPDSLVLEISRRYIHCYLQNQPTRFDGLAELAQHADMEYASIIMLEKMRTMNPARVPEACQPASNQVIAGIYEGLLGNPHFRIERTQGRLNEYLAEIAVSEGDLNTAMYRYDQAFAQLPSPIYPFRQATLLESAGLPDDARQYAAKTRQALTPKQKILLPDLAARLAQLEARLTGSPPATRPAR